MKDTYCMDKLIKFNNRIFLFIKKIKNLQEQEKGKTQISGPTWNASKFQNLKLRQLSDVMEAIKTYSIFSIFWDFDIIAWENPTGNDVVSCDVSTSV